MIFWKGMKGPYEVYEIDATKKQFMGAQDEGILIWEGISISPIWCFRIFCADITQIIKNAFP